MKTIKIILFALLLFPISAKAKVHYSTYGELGPYQDELIEKTDTLYVEKTKFYKAYKEILLYEDETSKKEKTGNIKYINEKWVTERPDKYLEEKILLDCRPYAKNRYYEISNNSYGPFDISLKISNVGDFKFRIEKMKKAIIQIPEDVSASNKIEYTITSEFLELIYEVHLKSDIEDTIIEKKHIAGDNYKSSIKDYIEKYEPISAVDQETCELTGNNIKKSIYKIADTLYEVKDKEYQDLYLLVENEDYKIDKTKYIYRYRSKSREKLEISDELFITNYDSKLEDFIKSTTEFKITSDINFYKNGKYTLNIITPYRVFTEDIFVDIKENYITLIKEQQKTIEVITNNLIDSNYKVEKKNQEIKEAVLESDDTFLATEVEKLKTTLKDVEGKKKDFDDVEKKEMSSIFIIILMTIFMFIPLLCRNKSSEKNI